jgi:Tol biopolymer transport system component
MVGSRSTLLVFCFGILVCAPLRAQVTERESVNWNGTQGNGGAELSAYPNPVVSADGRCVIFFSYSSNLVPQGSSGWQVFLHDRTRQANELVSVSTWGAEGDGVSGLFGLTISPDGRYVAFESTADNLVPGDTNGTEDVFVRDRLRGITDRVSVATSGAQGNDWSEVPSISADGRYVAFTSEANTLVPGDTNSTWDVLVRDRTNGITECVSVSTGGAHGDLASYYPSMSADGRYVAFWSDATNLVPGDSNGKTDVFVRDRQLGTTERVSVSTGGLQGDFGSASQSISNDGRYVAFTSYATNLVPGDTNGTFDVFVRDRRSGTTERVSVATGGAEGAGQSTFPSISADGRYVAFASFANNLVPGGSSGQSIFVRDRANGTTEIVSVTTQGAQSHYGGRDFPGSISADGRYVVFKSENRDLVAGDSNGAADIFLHDRAAAGFVSMCDPGLEGVAACPCSNPASTSGRGCDNSAATGGARLSASGIAYLSIDTLSFAATDELPSAFSTLIQGNAALANGTVYGQGVRCAGGATKRLFVKTATAGSITAPDFGAGDPTVSVRSAAQGDVIQPGQSRWYLVYYRDPIVLGGCSVSSTFNATQTGQVTWWP